MAIRPCNAWNTPTMIIMIAANMMRPTAPPLVCRPAREYASLLTADPSSISTDDRPHHGTCRGCRHYPFWDELAGGAAARAPARLGKCLYHRFEIELSPQPMLVAFNSRDRC